MLTNPIKERIEKDGLRLSRYKDLYMLRDIIDNNNCLFAFKETCKENLYQIRYLKDSTFMQIDFIYLDDDQDKHKIFEILKDYYLQCKKYNKILNFFNKRPIKRV